MIPLLLNHGQIGRSVQPDFEGADANFGSVVFLWPGYEADGATTFVDALGNTITNTGSPVATRSQSRYRGLTSANFNNCGIRSTGNANFVFGSGVAYTLEMWVYRLATPAANRALFTLAGSEAAGRMNIQIDTSNNCLFNVFGELSVIGATIPLRKWTYVQFTKTTGNVNRLYVDGIGSATQTNATNGNSNALNVALNASGAVGYAHDCHIQQVRLTRGVVRSSTVPLQKFRTV